MTTAQNTALFHEIADPIAAVHAVSSAAGVNSAWVSVKGYAKIAALIDVGLIAATGTFNAKITQATSAAGAGAKDITGKAIVALADTDDNKLMSITLDPSELDVNNGFTFIRLELIPATAAALTFGVLLGYSAAHEPVPTTNWFQRIN